MGKNIAGGSSAWMGELVGGGVGGGGGGGCVPPAAGYPAILFCLLKEKIGGPSE